MASPGHWGDEVGEGGTFTVSLGLMWIMEGGATAPWALSPWCFWVQVLPQVLQGRWSPSWAAAALRDL